MSVTIPNYFSFGRLPNTSLYENRILTILGDFHVGLKLVDLEISGSSPRKSAIIFCGKAEKTKKKRFLGEGQQATR